MSIMMLLDPLSIQCLRRTSRLFLRLFSSPEFRFAHATKRERWRFHPWQFHPWQVPKREYWRPSGRLRPLLDRDNQHECSGCQKGRSEPTGAGNYRYLNTEYLHCDGCWVDHPAALFSPTQRGLGPMPRVCRGHEGVLRICKHRTVSWAEVSSIARGLWGLEMGRGITRVSVPVVRCEDPDHIVKNHGSNAPQIFHRDEFPEVSVEKKFGGGISVYMRWTGHLRLPESDDTTSKQLSARIAADTMRQRLEQFRRGSPAGFIAPQLRPGRLMEMQCFDPNRCSCLQYSGSDLLPGHKWQMSPHGQSQQAICRTDPSNQQSCLHPQTAEGGGSQGKSRGQLPLGPSTKVSMCGRSGTPDASVVRIWMDCCPGDVDNSSRCLRIKYERVIKIVPTYVTKEHTPDLIMPAPISAGRPLPMAAAWCQALDPDSYESSNHENILWCRHQGCSNYYRNARHLFVPFEKVNRECGSECSWP